MQRAAVFVSAVVLAWLGFFVHNVADLPGQSMLSPESLYPSIVYVVLLALWCVPRLRTVATWALLVWAVLHFVGGAVLSVLPLPILPFTPDQSLHHYLFHGLYGVLQVPLIVLCVARLRRRATR
jgi:hypothetical protein